MKQLAIHSLPIIGRFVRIPPKHTALSVPGGIQFNSNLLAVVTHKDGSKSEYDLGSGLVTTAGVNLLALDYSNTTATLKLSNYHAAGTGVTAAAIGDTAMQTDSGVTRVAGTQSNPSAGQYRTVATLAFTSSLAITEWGLFSAITSVTMWDHKVFTAINVVNGDSIQFTYTLTCTAGG
jgi:hypothetical protein